MTFQFTDWTFSTRIPNKAAGPARRPRLVARWLHGEGGKLECRWVRVDPMAFLD